jgi:phytanoyl-CoA hydroxylase
VPDPELQIEELRQAFASDGFVSLPGFLGPDELGGVHEALRRFTMETVPSLPAELVYYEDKTDSRSLKQVQRLHEHCEFFAAMMLGSRFERLAQVLLGGPVVGKNMQYFNKPPGIGLPTPAHQDGAYFMLEPSQAVTMWLALEDVDLEQGCVRYVRASHLRGLRPHGRSGVLGFSRDILDYGSDDDLASEVAQPCRAGDLIAHHALTIHLADGNFSKERSREALGFIYYGRSAREDEGARAAYERQLASELADQRRI